MTELQVILTVVIFATVIIVIAADLLDMVIAALVGACALFIIGALTEPDVFEALRGGAGALSLLFGGMVVARVLAKTGIFDHIARIMLRATGGSGRRFLLLIILLVAPVCALLPNATTVILLAPVIVSVARGLNISVVGPMILTALVSNSAGLLTLVGDPATFLVGSSIGMSFNEYLKRVSPAGLLALLVIIPLLPRILPDIWKMQVPLPKNVELPPIERPLFVIAALAVLIVMVLLFLFGEGLPINLGPPGVAITAATLGFLIVYGWRVEPVDNVLRDVDWKTLIFLGAIFCMVQAFIKTGLMQSMALELHGWFGTQFTAVALVLLGGVGVLSAFLANLPVVAAALVMTKGYLVAAEVVPDIAMSPGFSAWPESTLPIFIAMMFGGTLGGNSTVIGAAANIVAAGICAAQGERVTFLTFLRYGIPITIAQLAVSALYVYFIS